MIQTFAKAASQQQNFNFSSNFFPLNGQKLLEKLFLANQLCKVALARTKFETTFQPQTTRYFFVDY